MVPPEAYAASNHYYQSLSWSRTEEPSWIEASRTTISQHGAFNVTAYGETEASHGTVTSSETSATITNHTCLTIPWLWEPSENHA